MNMQNIQVACNRAFFLSLSKKKLALTIVVLFLCGLVGVFFRSIAMHAGQWTLMSIVFLPVILFFTAMMALGVVLIRLYHDEIKNKELNVQKVIVNSGINILQACFLGAPIFLAFLLLWLCLGVFFLLDEIPGIGLFVGVVFVFIPFILNVAAICLVVAYAALMFFITPIVALGELNALEALQSFWKRFTMNAFDHLAVMGIAFIPVAFWFCLLVKAVRLTLYAYDVSDHPIGIALQCFFIMVPFAALLSPAVVFFFNLAAESLALLKKR